MLVEIDRRYPHFTAWVPRAPSEKPSDPAWNRIARERQCDPDDMTWTGDTAMTPPDETHSGQE